MTDLDDIGLIVRWPENGREAVTIEPDGTRSKHFVGEHEATLRFVGRVFEMGRRAKALEIQKALKP